MAEMSMTEIYELIVGHWPLVILAIILAFVCDWCQDRLNERHAKRLVDDIMGDIKKEAIAVWHVPRPDEEQVEQEITRWHQDNTYVPIIRL